MFYVTFLSLNKKVTKELSSRGAERLAQLRTKSRLRRLRSARACGRSRNPIRPLENLPARYAVSAEQLNDRNFQTYGFALGVGSALAALPIQEAANFKQKIGTFSA